MFDIRLLFTALVWGVNFSIIKSALVDFQPLVFTVVRFCLGSLFLFCVMLVKRDRIGLDRRDLFAVGRLGFIGITLYSILFMHGLQRTTAANSALLISLSPLFGSLIQAARGRERMTFRIAAGLLLASCGVFLVITSHHGSLSFSSDAISGDLLTLCATVSWALYTIASRPLLARHSSVKVTAWSMAFGSILLVPVSLAEFSSQSWGAIPASSWLAMAFAAFIAAGIAYVFWYQGVQRIGVTRTMAYHYLMPFFAVLFAAFAFHERITPSQIIGGIAIVSGVFLVQSNQAKSKS